MKTNKELDGLNSFLDFNHDGKIDETEEFVGYMMMQASNDNDDAADDDEEEEVIPTF